MMQSIKVKSARINSYTINVELEGVKPMPNNIAYPIVTVMDANGSRLGEVSLIALTPEIKIPTYIQNLNEAKLAYIVISGIYYACKIE